LSIEIISPNFAEQGTRNQSYSYMLVRIMWGYPHHKFICSPIDKAK